ncbi:MAG: hypothetical protein H7839_04985 [Magnetococcus sp. YQC-5]
MSTGALPMYLFDRCHASHRWDRALQVGAAPPLLDPQLVARNWRMDHRVADARETSLLENDIFSGTPDLEIWASQVNRFYEKQIQLRSFTSDAPASLMPDTVAVHNRNNRLDHYQLVQHDQLFHLASFNRLLNGLMSDRFGMHRFRGFLLEMGWDDPMLEMSSPPKISEKTKWIEEMAEKVAAEGAETIKKVAGALMKAFPMRIPWWAAFAEEAVPWIDHEDWSGLCKALGIGHFLQGEWLMAWEYPVSVAGPLYRPTVVEAGKDPFHFPSPPGSPVGVVMNLDEHQEVALREVVHLALTPVHAHKYCLTKMVQLGESHVVDRSMLPRQRHKRRLAEEFVHDPDREWLARHDMH